MEKLFANHIPCLDADTRRQLSEWGIADEHVDALVPTPSSRRNLKGLDCHVAPAGTKPSFTRVAADIYACTPELTFAQVGDVYSRIELIRMGYELCGTYIPSDEDTMGFVSREPLTSVAKIRKCLTSHPTTRSGRKALCAARRVLDGSASPAETALAMQLSLPKSLGGFGISPPQLNHPIDLDALAQRILHQEHAVCDEYWSGARLDVEYDSDLWHTGTQRIVRDSLRRDALSHMGISIITVTRAQMYDSFAMEQIAKVIGGQAGQRQRSVDPDWHQRYLDLRDAILSQRSGNYPSAWAE